MRNRKTPYSRRPRRQMTQKRKPNNMNSTSIPCKNDVVGTFLDMLQVIKMYHWSTHSFAEHKAADELYSKLDKNVDGFVETMLAESTGSRFPKLRKNIVIREMASKEEMRKRMELFRAYLIRMDRCFGQYSPDLMSIRDAILGDVNQFLYLMSLQK
jgi:hypothetical protein